MVTTETEMTRVVKALGAGLDAYVMKPFTKEAVVEQLERIGFGAIG
jgi:two-component system chemotaxis response regulator CheY